MRYFNFLFSFICGFLVHQQAISQSIIGHSPISRFGLGQSLGHGVTRVESMAGVGIASPHSDHPNLINPALLAYNEKVQFDIDLKYWYRNLSGPGSASYKAGAGGLAHFSIIIPVHKKVTTSLGIKPFTVRDFVFNQKVPYPDGDTLGFRSRGLGGTTQFFISNSVQIGSNLSLGLEASYVFGTLEDSVSFGALPVTNNFNFISIYKRKVSQILVKPGIHIRIPLAKENTFFSFGATADIGSAIQYKNFRTFTIKGAGAEKDTLENGNSASLDRPLTYSGAIGIFNPFKGSISAELDWIKAPGQNDENSIVQNSDAFAVRLGGEYMIGTRKSTKYLNIMTFRAGISYQQLPFKQNSEFLTEKKISIGASFPIIRKEAKFSRPLINLGLAIGQRGLKNSNVGLENYFQVSLGFTMNDFLWFNRYKID